MYIIVIHENHEVLYRAYTVIMMLFMKKLKLYNAQNGSKN